MALIQYPIPPIPGTAGPPALPLFLSQLELLQALMPLDYWVVGLENGGALDILARHGRPDPQARPVSRELLDRGLGQTIFIAPHGGHSCYAFKAALPEGGGVAVVGGFSWAEPLPCHRARAPEIRACMLALVRMVILHVHLADTDRQLQRIRLDGAKDLLTGVLNRSGWENAVQELEGQESEAAIGFLDLDSLKAVNDAYGHAAGDALLRRTALTIRQAVRHGDLVGRLGGDEFGVMMARASFADAATLKSRLRSALDAAGIKASIGMALKSEVGSLSKTVGVADARMYEDKRSRRSRERSLSAAAIRSLPESPLVPQKLRRPLSPGSLLGQPLNAESCR